MKTRFRLINPMPVIMGFQGKVYVDTPKGSMPLPPTAVTCAYPSKDKAVVTHLAKYVVVKNGWYHLCHKN